MDAPLPVNRDLELLLISLMGDEDLANGGPEETFLENGVRFGVVPDLLEVAGKLVKTPALFVGQIPRGLCHQVETSLGLLQLGKSPVELLLQGRSDEPVLGVDQVVLLEGSVGFVLSSLDLQPGGLELLRLLPFILLGRLDRRFDREGSNGAQEFSAHRLVDNYPAPVLPASAI